MVVYSRLVGRKNIIVEVAAVTDRGIADLSDVGNAADDLRLFPRGIQRGEKHAGKNRDDRYYITGYNDDYNNLLIILLCI